MQEHHYSLTELENMMPWEREIYIGLLEEYIKANELSDFRMEFFILIYCAQDDYKSLVDKYCLVRDDFERKMTLAAKHFQDVESAHLKQMREFIESYCQIVDNNNNLLGRVRILF